MLASGRARHVVQLRSASGILRYDSAWSNEVEVAAGVERIFGPAQSNCLIHMDKCLVSQHFSIR